MAGTLPDNRGKRDRDFTIVAYILSAYNVAEIKSRELVIDERTNEIIFINPYFKESDGTVHDKRHKILPLGTAYRQPRNPSFDVLCHMPQEYWMIILSLPWTYLPGGKERIDRATIAMLKEPHDGLWTGNL